MIVEYIGSLLRTWRRVTVSSIASVIHLVLNRTRIPVDVLRGASPYLPIPSSDPGVERVDRVEVFDLVVLLPVDKAALGGVQTVGQSLVRFEAFSPQIGIIPAENRQFVSFCSNGYESSFLQLQSSRNALPLQCLAIQSSSHMIRTEFSCSRSCSALLMFDQVTQEVYTGSLWRCGRHPETWLGFLTFKAGLSRYMHTNAGGQNSWRLAWRIWRILRRALMRRCGKDYRKWGLSLFLLFEFLFQLILSSIAINSSNDPKIDLITFPNGATSSR